MHFNPFTSNSWQNSYYFNAWCSMAIPLSDVQETIMGWEIVESDTNHKVKDIYL